MVDIYICVGSSCHLKGSYSIIEELKRLIALEKLENMVNLKASFCTGDCTNGVCIEIDGEKIQKISRENVGTFFESRVLPAVARL